MGADLDYHWNNLLKSGYTIFEDALTSTEVQRYRDEVEDLWRIEKIENTKLCSRPPQMIVANLAARTRVFDSLLSHPFIISTGSKLLGKDFILSELRSLNLEKGLDVPFIHQDGFIPTHAEFPLAFIAFWILDDFSAENGATKIFPGSHNFSFPVPKDPKLLEPFVSKSLEAKSGSLVILNANIWHGPGPNLTGKNRRIISAFYVRWFIKQYFNMPARIPREHFHLMSPDLKRILGFNSIPPLDEKERINTVVPIEEIEKYFRFNHTLLKI